MRQQRFMGFFVSIPTTHKPKHTLIMAIKLSANYSKKLGLPQYSSHSFSASIETELSDINQAEAEIARLYGLLQQSVDQEIQNPGFVPEGSGSKGTNGHHTSQNERTYPLNGNVHRAPLKPVGHGWNCTEGQRGFILRIINENQLSKQEAEDLSQQLFGTGVKELNKMQASQLIEDLLVKVGKSAPRQALWQQRSANQAA
jgi:hypothetical protein